MRGRRSSRPTPGRSCWARPAATRSTSTAPATPRPRGPSRCPAAGWLRGELQPFAREVLSIDTGLLDRRAIERVLDRHVSRREDLSRQLWGLLSFTLWWERYAAPTRVAA